MIAIITVRHAYIDTYISQIWAMMRYLCRNACVTVKNIKKDKGNT